MKKYINYILLIVAVMCTGCKQFLSTESPSSLGTAIFASPDQTEQAIAGIYVILGEQNAYRTRLGGYWVMPGTDCEMAVSNAPDFSIYTMSKVGHSDLNTKDKNPWAYLTMAIERCNVVIDGIEHYSDTIDKDESKTTRFRYLYGEALTLRAWLYYEMVKLWGDVPYMFSPMDGSDASIYPKKVDRNIIFDKLRIDLRHAAELMPNAANCPGVANNTVERCNREFALGLLARIDLMYAGKAMRPDQLVEGSTYRVQYNTTPEKRTELLEEVIWACNEVIVADGLEKLMENYEDVFRAVSGSVTQYTATESLFEIPFADGVRGQFMNRMGAYINKDELSHAKLKGISSNFKSNAKIVVPPAFLFSFEKGDKRKWVTVSPGEWTYDADSKIPGVSESVLYQKPEKINKMYMGKYRAEWMSFTCMKEEDGINIPQMRFADILLMYAEAAIGGEFYEVNPSNADMGKAQDYFNKVRARAGLTTKTLNRENLMAERAHEFAGEFIRKYDLIRWGVFAENLWNTQEDLKNFTHLVTDPSSPESGKIDFSGTPYEGLLPTSVYVKYELDNSVTQDGSAAYRISEIYGLELGESTQPADYVDETDNGGWVKIDAFLENKLPCMKVEEKGNLIFGVELSKEELEARQFWPILNVITSANHNLWNDYGY